MIIDTIIKPKRFFNVNDKKDIALAKKFFSTHSWGGDCCPFVLEFPYMTIPDMIRDKLIHKHLGIKYDRRHHWGMI